MASRMLEDFEALSRALQIRVDDAFNAAVNSKSIRPSSSKSTASANPELAGGFDVESDDPPGNFIPPKANNTHPLDGDLIPLSLIPSALQFLDLPPDDEEVLEVFQNAAGGWGAPSTDGVFIASHEGEERVITRQDWRAVCAVIIGDPREEDTAGGFLIDKEQTAPAGVEENPLHGKEIEERRNEEEEIDDGDNDDDDEAYQESSLSFLSSGQGSDAASDEYNVGPSSLKGKSKSSNRKSKRTSASISYGTPTSHQKRASLDAFALFFPSSLPLTDADLSTKRLMFKDIVRVAAMLKEKIKAEEVCF